jgi:hypothetical protein
MMGKWKLCVFLIESMRLFSLRPIYSYFDVCGAGGPLPLICVSQGFLYNFSNVTGSKFCIYVYEGILAGVSVFMRCADLCFYAVIVVTLLHADWSLN